MKQRKRVFKKENCFDADLSYSRHVIDSGAGGKFIEQNYVRKLGVKVQKLEQPLIA